MYYVYIYTHTYIHTLYVIVCIYNTIYNNTCIYIYLLFIDFPGSSDGKEFACDEGDLGSISWSGRLLGEGNDYLL